MRIIFLNALGAQLQQPLADFLLREVAATDIFCFQEAADGERLVGQGILGDYQLFSAQEPIEDSRQYVLATYIRSTIQVVGHSSISQDNHSTGLGLLVHLVVGARTISILNVHGNPHAIQPHDTKRDSPERLHQSDDFLKAVASAEPDIIGGDFNLLPDTESIERFRRAGYQDLIRKYRIKTTRNHLTWDRYPDKQKYLFSDYVFVSQDFLVESFTVPDVEVSDHQPMVLDVALAR
jgi:endonuclease/exonuclease/phosphatase family metal-dependent hydrolase